ncbi:DUF4062 domain-containing protein [Rhizobium leguminosarum]|uniref:DUF4062 domain-containing protein n=1 Tax=Rhizobium leguminosarum TaxID=384 RepID=UPI000FEC4E69|nr:DUF4062 domain-containing protein [Rhizobium leguminosarum]RWX30523.1 DUF4062 domain-containing protein [Rhizobium leguminosarum]
MAAKKYQVFVSSTFRDLVDERQDTIRNILDLNHIPAGMELFPAADVEQLDYIKKVIDECDYYLLIVGGRYGSLDADGVSFTEREYDYAVTTGKFVIAFVHGEPEAISVKNSDIKPELATALRTFRDKVMNGRLVRTWKDRQDLQLVVLKSLMHAFSAHPQIGWIRGDTAANEQVLEQSNKALQENAELREQLAKLTTQQQPAFENIADLDDVVQIRYRTRYSSTRGLSYTDRTTTLKWRQIFVPLAAELTTSKTDGVIFNAVKLAMKEVPDEYTPYDMNEMDSAKIKAQFIALGLITAFASKTTSGGYAEFLSLTAKGRTVYMGDIVVRKATPT